PHLRRQVARFEQVLDANRQPINRRQRAASLPARRAGVSSGAGSSLVERSKSLHHGLVRRDRLQTTFKIGTRRVRAVAEAWRGIVKGACPESAWIVGFQSSCGHAILSLPSSSSALHPGTKPLSLC